MKTDELFSKLISQPLWYKKIGISRQNAYLLRKRFQDGTLGNGTKYYILERAGYEFTDEWKEKGGE